MKSNDNEEWVVCRACLKQPEGEMQLIFDENPELDLSEMFADCAGLPVRIHDDFPDKICSKCLKYLRVAYKFRVTCQRSYEHLSQMFYKTEEFQPPPALPKKEELPNNGFNLTLENFKVEVEDDEIEITGESRGDEENETVEFFVPLDEIPENEEVDQYEEFQVIETVDSPSSDIVIDEIVGDDMETEEEFLSNAIKVKTEPRKKGPRVKDEMAPFSVTIKKEEEPKIPKKRGRKKMDRTSSYICDVCGNIYPSQGRLTEHMKFHSDIKPHECEICGRGFVQAQQLVRHMNTHTGNRPYKCNYCPAAFADRSTKTKHHRIHTNERPYICDVCNRAFTYSDNLKFHKMLHTGEKPHVCDICGKGFTKAYKLKCHKNTHEKKGIVSLATT